MTEIVPGIHQIEVPMPESPLGNLNAYLVKSDGQCLLVDTGENTDLAFGALARQLGDLGVALPELTHIVLTHVHHDHYGLAGRLKQHCSAQVMIHEVEATYIQPRYVHYDNLLEEMAQWLRINGVPGSERTRLKMASMPFLERTWVVMPDRTVRGGEHFSIGEFDLEVIWTPGHTPGHICLYERTQRILFAGDHILADITPNFSMHAQSDGDPLADYLGSLETVEALPARVVLPAHRSIIDDLGHRVRDIRQHVERRRQDVLRALASGRKSAYEVASQLPFKTKGVAWANLPPMHKRSAVLETLSHLERLRLSGMIEKTARDGVFYYGAK